MFGHSGRSALEHLLESLPEAVIQKGVEKRIEAGVGVTQARDEVGNPDQQRRRWQIRGERYNGAQVERRPAKQANGQDDKNHNSDFLLGFV